ncbi:MAG: tetratricopeptide repeat protein [Betaproteobacteria bacterium]|nr:tetratricopeptide repeat protein [Betaproteobacteria bacterium]
MALYGVRDVERLLGLPRSTIRALIAAGFVAPARGPRNAWLFSFQDLIVMRKAQALSAARVPRRRIARAMRELRRQAESGQYPLDFEGAATLSALQRPAESARGWFARALALEGEDDGAALRAYERAVAADPAFLDARINLGLLLHESGRMARAERAYRDALEACGSDPVLLYNFGVLLTDMKRTREAVAKYQAALRADPALADCHYNLALLYEELGRPKEALRHMAQYRRLSAPRRK